MERHTPDTTAQKEFDRESIDNQIRSWVGQQVDVYPEAPKGSVFHQGTVKLVAYDGKRILVSADDEKTVIVLWLQDGYHIMWKQKEENKAR